MLSMFLRRPPVGAERVMVFGLTQAGEVIVQDRSAAESRAAPVQLANSVLAICERWARTEGRETRFRAQWQAGDRVLASHQWKCGEGDPTVLDGTVESLISQSQRHLENKDRIHLEAYTDQNTGWRELLAAYREEMKVLRAENAELRKRNQKANDVEAEIALRSVDADIEAKGRTADLLEHRVLPMLQHLALKAVNGLQPPAAAGSAAPPAAAAQGGETNK